MTDSDRIADLEKRLSAFIKSRANGDQPMLEIYNGYGQALLTGIHSMGWPCVAGTQSSILFSAESAVPLGVDDILNIFGDAIQPAVARGKELFAAIWRIQLTTFGVHRMPYDS